LANTTELFVCGNDAAGLMSNYFDHLLLFYVNENTTLLLVQLS